MCAAQLDVIGFACGHNDLLGPSYISSLNVEMLNGPMREETKHVDLRQRVPY